MPPIGDYALIGGIAAVCSYLLTFPLRRLATRMSFVAQPGERRLHQLPIPYGGGLAMFLAFLAAIIFADRVPSLHGVFQGSSEPLGVVLGAAVILGVGMLDDRGRYPPRRRWRARSSRRCSSSSSAQRCSG